MRALGIKPAMPDLLMSVPSGPNSGLAWNSRADPYGPANRRSNGCASCRRQLAGCAHRVQHRGATPFSSTSCRAASDVKPVAVGKTLDGLTTPLLGRDMAFAPTVVQGHHRRLAPSA